MIIIMIIIIIMMIIIITRVEMCVRFGISSSNGFF